MQTLEASPDDIAAELGRIAIEAGQVLLAHRPDACGERLKEDGSPTTDADLEAEHLILERLAVLSPGVPVIAEETAALGAPGPLFYLVDPLDGTREFLAGSAEYTVNIALIAGARPIAAAVAAPGLGRLFVAGDEARAAAYGQGRCGELLRIAVRAAPPQRLVALVSRRHGDAASDACLDRLGEVERRATGSSLKFCLIAAGEADLYVRCGPTMEWDIAAGDHILSAAGGCVVQADRAPVTYGHVARRYRNPPFAAVGDPALPERFALPSAA